MDDVGVIEGGFFAKKENQEIISRYYSFLSETKSSAGEGFEGKLRGNVKTAILLMQRNPDMWDKRCIFNIRNLGSQFIKLLARTGFELGDMRMVYVFISRFITEAYMLSPLSEELENFRSLLKFGLDNIDQFNELEQEQLRYAREGMSIDIIRSAVNSQALIKIRNFEEFFEKSNKTQSDWDEALKDKINRVDELSSILDRQETAFNFVGLYNGFDALSKLKNKEAGFLSKCLMVLGGAILLPAILEIALVYILRDDFDRYRNLLLASLIPAASMVIILIYFFRVLLSEYKAIRSQVLQVDLRKTLCAFIQEYAKYAKEIRVDNPEALTKFESVVFAGIVSGEDKLPSTFDGLEQIAGLIKSVRDKP